MKGFPWKLFGRFLAGQILVIVGVLALAGISTRFVFRDWILGASRNQSREMLLALRQDLGEELSLYWCESHTVGNFTFSILDSRGNPICTTIEPGTRGAREPVRAKDFATAMESEFGTLVEINPADDVPVLFSSLLVKERGLVLRSARPLHHLKEAMDFFDRSLVVILLVLAGGFAGVSALLGRRLVFPLGRLIVKARGATGAEPATAELDLSEERADEWVDLETALDRIRGDLKVKTEALAREREELATLMSAISDAILAVDASGVPLFFNSRFALLFSDRGLRDGRPALAELFRAPEILEAFNHALREGRSRETGFISLHVAGSPVPRDFVVSVAPLRKDGGEVYGAVGIFHDVSELRRAERIRIEFVANVSHELRTPLTSIKGYTDTLLGDVKQGRMDSLQPFLEVISRNVDRLMALIKDLLDLSSIESGQEVVRAPVDTRELTGRVLHQLEGLRTSKLQLVEAEYQVATVMADARRLEQVLVNLLENAIKYVPTAGKIRVKWERADKGALLRVADNGPGIPAEYQSRLFERFYRIDKARSREMGGTGLGLAIVKHIMQAHGGSVYVMSEVGKGSEFVCVFPD